MHDCILKNVVILIRHGARTPIRSDSILHNQIYKNWKRHNAHLTTIGKKQSEILGKNIGNKYYKIGYKPYIICADSSDTQRTKESLKCFIKGWNSLYKKIYSGKYYYIKNKGRDPFLKLKYKFSKLNNTNEKSIIKHHFIEKNIDNLLKNIKIQLKNKCNLELKISNQNIPFVFTKVYNSIELNNASNDHNPIIKVNENKKILKYFAKATFNKKYTRKKSLKVIGSTPKIIYNQLFNNKKTATFLFSHDNIFAAYLTYLGLYDWPLTNFNGYLTLELWEHYKTKNQYITISYNPNPFMKISSKFHNNTRYFSLPPVGKHSYYHNISSLSQIPMKKKVFINRYNQHK